MAFTRTSITAALNEAFEAKKLGSINLNESAPIKTVQEYNSESVTEAAFSLNEGFDTWLVRFEDMNLSGVELRAKNEYKVKARTTVEAIKKAAKMAGLKGDSWMATVTDSIEKL